jgi:5'-3' exonuclease
MTTTDGTYTAISPFDRLAALPAALVTPGFDPQKFKISVQRSRRFRLANLQLFEAAEATAKTPEAKRKISHYMRGLQKVIQRLDDKEKALDKMIKTGIIPYGIIFT